MTDDLKSLRWLHISDLHLRSEGFDQNVVVRGLLRSLGTNLAHLRPDLIFCSGDVADSGAPKEYECAREFFRELGDICKLSGDQILIAPGNHDVDRTRVSRSFPLRLESRNAATWFFSTRTDLDFASIPFGNYASFVSDLCDTEFKSTVSVRKSSVRGFEVCTLLINSSLLHVGDGHMQGQLVIGEMPLREALADAFPTGAVASYDLVVAVLHHPLWWLADFEREIVEGMLAKYCDVIMHGHVHELVPREKDVPLGHFIEFSAGALYQGRDLVNSIYYVECFGGHMEVTPLRFHDQGEGRWVEDHATLEARPNGNAYAIKRTIEVQPPPDNSEEVYLQSVVREHTHINLAMETSTETEVQATLVDLYVPLTVRIQGTDGRVPLADFFMDQRFGVLLGLPGSGKTTSLRYHAMLAALAHLTDQKAATHSQPIPVLVSASLLWSVCVNPETSATPDSMLQAIVAAKPQIDRRMLNSWISTCGVFLMVDALDELQDERDRVALVDVVRTFARSVWADDSPSRVLLASRPYAYKPVLEMGQPFSVGQIEPLRVQDVGSFTKLWIKVLHRIPREQPLAAHPSARLEWRRLEHALWGNASLTRLELTPMLLTVYAILFHRRGDLSGNRAELYSALVEALLRRYRRRGVARIPEVMSHLAQVAYRFQEDGDAAREPDEVIDLIAANASGEARVKDREWARELLEHQELQAGILVARTPRRFEFLHQTFQEYFTGYWIAESMTLGELSVELHKRLGDDDWTESLRFLVAILASHGSGRLREVIRYYLERSAPGERARSIARLMSILLEITHDEVHPRVFELIRSYSEDLAKLLCSVTEPERIRIGAAEALGRIEARGLSGRMLPVAAGDFLFGAALQDGAAYELERKSTKRELPLFFVGEFPVTVSEFMNFVAHPSYREDALWQEGFKPRRESHDLNAVRFSNHPATFVNWHEANAYCRWLNAIRPRNDGLVYRLPTEEEWEKAARGPANVRSRRFPWGDEMDPGRLDHWATERLAPGPAPVGCFPLGLGPYGAFDQAGGVWEWCWDRLEPKSNENSEPEGTEAEYAQGAIALRAVRGGSWRGDITIARVSYPDWVSPSRRVDDVGFRVIAGQPLAPEEAN